ncbi:hypothetical protein ATK30_1563 [Amycolatopsis echigonensis]|uniref:Uncharacterized protein n=1 Tax=Amycolatopsis echigonensis TaxID=2576905 RepID=A0A2N3WAB5_9PSEU|nr:hypothetical protein ATK30_1563 [Amycolatopsis niigatensis]
MGRFTSGSTGVHKGVAYRFDALGEFGSRAAELLRGLCLGSFRLVAWRRHCAPGLRGAPRSPSVLTVWGCLSRRERCLDKHPQTAGEASYRGAGVVWVLGGLGVSVAVW